MPIDAPMAEDGTGIRVGRGIILGPGGSGKTELAAILCKEWVPEEHRESRLFCVGPVPKLASRVGVQNYPVDWKSREKQDEFFNRINDMEGAAVVAIDEADLYYTGGGRSYGSKEFLFLANVGRNFGKGFIVIARGDSDVASNTRGQATCVFVFNTSEKNLLNHAEEWFFDVPDVREYITSLQPHEFMLWCPNLNPRWQGTGKVVNGTIYIQPPDEAPEESPESETSPEGTPTSDSSASTPAATAPSATPPSPSSAVTTIPSGSGKSGG